MWSKSLSVGKLHSFRYTEHWSAKMVFHRIPQLHLLKLLVLKWMFFSSTVSALTLDTDVPSSGFSRHKMLQLSSQGHLASRPGFYCRCCCTRRWRLCKKKLKNCWDCPLTSLGWGVLTLRRCDAMLGIPLCGRAIASHGQGPGLNPQNLKERRKSQRHSGEHM